MEPTVRRRTVALTRGFHGPMENEIMDRLSIQGASLAVALIMLAGCGGSQRTIGILGAMPQTSAIATHAERDGSWMLPEAKSDDLLYVSNSDNVTVYSYATNKLVGELKGFFNSVGLCVDANGDVFVTNENPVGVFEYPHGGSKSIATFLTRHVGAIGCAVDPSTGNLAVTGNTQYANVFRPGNAKPRVIKDKGMFYNQFCTYDDHGDLFVNGLANPSQHTPRLAVLLSQGHRFTKINLNAYMYPEGGIQWNGGRLTTLSYTKRNDRAQLIRFTIAGSNGTKVGVTPLNKPADLVSQYFITGNTVIVPNLYDSHFLDPELLFYKYPAGGAPTSQLTKRITAPFGVVVSVATK
jgi:hypothetical protein